MYRAHLEVLKTWNETVDVSSPLDEDWFEKPGILFPWLLDRGGSSIGFALVGNHRLARAMGAETDFYFHEFHVAGGARRQGVGRAAVELVFSSHPGSMALDVLPANGPAMTFWSRVFEGARQVEWISEDGVRFIRFETPG